MNILLGLLVGLLSFVAMILAIKGYGFLAVFFVLLILFVLAGRSKPRGMNEPR